MPEVKLDKENLIKPIKSMARKKAVRHPGWGGARPGAGRKPEGATRLDSMMVVRLTKEQKACLKTFGSSSWLRKLLQLCVERKAVTLEDGAAVFAAIEASLPAEVAEKVVDAPAAEDVKVAEEEPAKTEKPAPKKAGKKRKSPKKSEG